MGLRPVSTARRERTRRKSDAPLNRIALSALLASGPALLEPPQEAHAGLVKETKCPKQGVIRRRTALSSALLATRDLMASASSARIRPTRRQSVQPTAVSAQRTRGTRIARVRRAYATRDSEAAAVVRRIQSALSVVRVPTRPQREMQFVCLARPESGRM